MNNHDHERESKVWEWANAASGSRVEHKDNMAVANMEIFKNSFSKEDNNIVLLAIHMYYSWSLAGDLCRTYPFIDFNI